MQGATTDHNLSVISNRNRGHRASLFLNDDYLNSSSEDEAPAKQKVPELDISRIQSKIDLIDKANKHVRRRGKKDKKNKGDESEIRKEKDELEGQLSATEKKGPQTQDGRVSVSHSSETHDDKYRSNFGDIEFLETSTTILDDPEFKTSRFFGVYVLFWLATGFLMLNNLVHAYVDHGIPFYKSPVVEILRTDLFKIALTDLSMYLSTYFSLWVQKMCLSKRMNWSKSGWLIQGTYDCLFLFGWTFCASEYGANYHWIGRVFLMLHSLVLLMKMHSYGFYNGYLWSITEELEFSKKYLERCTPEDDLANNHEDIDRYKTTLLDSIKFCEFELKFQGSRIFDTSNPAIEQDTPPVSFPDNINLKNFFEFSMFPTVVYTLNFPRTKAVRWGYVGEKVLAVFGIFFLMVIIAQSGMYPLVMQAIDAKSLPFTVKVQKYLMVLLDMIPYFLLQYLFTFFIIWEFILNVIAELSRFADRDFYGSWWSCTDWAEFARIWNRPVHKFLLRHVYHSSISAIKLNKMQATLFTFVLSSLIHELVMLCIFKTLRGYLLLFQMSQIPLVMISHTKFMRNQRILGNCICWIGFISGPSIICTLYLFF